jgi:hypothetical protein
MTQPPIVPGNPQPQPGPVYGPPQFGPPPPKKKGLGTGAIVAIILGPLALVALVVGICLYAGFAGMAGDQKLIGDEVTIVNCGTTSAGNLMAEVRVENKSDRERSYWVTVEFLNGSDRVADGRAYVTDVRPGQSARETVVARGPDVTRCQVTDVSTI